MKNKLLFCGVLLLGFLFYAQISSAQEKNNVTYKIINTGTVTNIQPYIDALNAADMTSDRFYDTSRVIVFNTGVKVELFSAKKLIADGENVDISRLCNKNSIKKIRQPIVYQANMW